jgi:hypothetical protein
MRVICALRKFGHDRWRREHGPCSALAPASWLLLACIVQTAGGVVHRRRAPRGTASATTAGPAQSSLPAATAPTAPTAGPAPPFHQRRRRRRFATKAVPRDGCVVGVESERLRRRHLATDRELLHAPLRRRRVVVVEVPLLSGRCLARRVRRDLRLHPTTVAAYVPTTSTTPRRNQRLARFRWGGVCGGRHRSHRRRCLLVDGAAASATHSPHAAAARARAHAHGLLPREVVFRGRVGAGRPDGVGRALLCQGVRFRVPLLGPLLLRRFIRVHSSLDSGP